VRIDGPLALIPFFRLRISFDKLRMSGKMVMVLPKIYFGPVCGNVLF